MSPTPTWAVDSSVPPVKIQRGLKTIAALQLPETGLVLQEPDSSHPTYFVRLTGSFSTSVGSLIVRQKAVKSDVSGHFLLDLLVDREQTNLTFTVVDFFGKAQNETVLLQAPGLIKWFASREAQKLPVRPVSRHQLSLGLSVTDLAYTDNRLPYSGNVPVTLTELVLTVQANYRYYLIPNRLSIQFSGFYAGLPFQTSLPGISVKFVGLQGFFNYGFFPPQQPINFWLGLGGYYSTTSSGGAAFGYRNVSGPLVLPRLNWRLGSGDVIATYFKYALVNTSFTSLLATSREMAGGLSYTWKGTVVGAVAWSVGVDISDLKLSLPGGQAASVSYSLGVSASFGI